MLTSAPASTSERPPPRCDVGIVRTALLCAAILVVLVSEALAMGLSPWRLAASLPKLAQFLVEMFPPDFSGWRVIISATWTTVRIAFVGTAMGLAASCLMAVLASRFHAPTEVVHRLARLTLSAIRTIPELIWAILFVICVGLGPLAGVLAISFDTVGFAGRFFADALDDTPRGPREALQSFGASKLQVLFAASLPDAFPALIGIALHSLERAIRASVILGIVGAGGIGIELMVAIKLFEYQRALAIILTTLAVVVVVESVSARLRRGVQSSGGGRLGSS